MINQNTILRLLKTNQSHAVFGVCSAETLSLKTYNAKTPFVKGEAELRLNPACSLPGCKSIIAAGLSYNKITPVCPDDVPRGVFSLNACGEDYHITLRRLLNDLAASLAANLGEFNYTVHVDTGSLVESEFAIRAGLGSRGKHNLVINDKIGSMFNIGLLLTDIELEPSIQACSRHDICGCCTLCAKACPTGALKTNGGFEYTKCVSYLTQKKGELSINEQAALGAALYGCDICQTVCPKNTCNKINETLDTNEMYPPLKDIINMSNQEFKRIYKNRACYWRGADVLRRNAKIVLNNITGKAWR